MSFSQLILLWYAKNKRSLPWRRTRDPYKIWLSEIILQQTRVAQGIPYYERFLEAFPTVTDLANSSEESVLKLWQGLGYYSRARNLYATAKTVAQEYNGKFPESYKELLKLKGIGDYTASAISSICFNEVQPVVDGNVYRVLARYFGISTPINSTAGITYFKEMADSVMDVHSIRDYNQGIMEFGAIQCTPKSPNCSICPLRESCKALQSNQVAQLPVKLNKNKVRNRYFNYLVPLISGPDGHARTVLQKRIGKGIWENLYEFPLLESDQEMELEALQNNVTHVLGLKQIPEIYLYNSYPIVHKLSHQNLHTQFWIVPLQEEIANSISFSDVTNYPVPVLIADFINTFKI
jgi:A/G-specific adenine glycosylase